MKTIVKVDSNYNVVKRTVINKKKDVRGNFGLNYTDIQERIKGGQINGKRKNKIKR